MSDLFELQLSLDLPSDLSDNELSSLRWHLGAEDHKPLADPDDPDNWPLLCYRGPATRIGGLVTGDLQHGRRGWSLTVRQEVHPDGFSLLDSLLSWLGARTTTIGTVGSLRFLEDHVPDLFIAEAGSITRVALMQQQAEATLLPYE
ncbi:hypothetical protein H9Y04_18115 [Streptomyces sp. TRM66268-LWL]|uniref:Uncharacterized protein n=1 Tax=Streptomyces polyasparticus TaxID=2767826 RepID=A0ABR7SHS1_9ACTN|nr:hypothetical protein [Streptomyces polyasparticus]MBC9714479.1 hypothetical protein [Streptomyces polyasparticus]